MNGVRPRPPWMLASLLLNVFLLGGLAGGAAYYAWSAPQRHAATPSSVTQQGADPAAAGAPRGLRFAADALPPDKRQAFRNGLRDARRAAADQVRAAREGRMELAGLMAAARFDRQAVDAALARIRAADVALRERVEASVADFAATLSPEERTLFAQGLATQSTLRVPPAAAARP